MPKKTTFEQVPLEQIEKMIEEQAMKEKARAPTQEMKEKQPKPAVPPKNNSHGKGGKR
jgi:hypothetical protein